MKYDPEIHHRRSIRLRSCDYAQAGAYFVTLCTHDRMCLLGSVVEGDMRLNDAGQFLQATWEALPDHYPHVELDEFVVMPNHVHGIIVLDFTATITRHGLAEIVRALKTFSARRINEQNQTPGVKV
jgi:REP element-mobilizing transposase RayT